MSRKYIIDENRLTKLLSSEAILEYVLYESGVDVGEMEDYVDFSDAAAEREMMEVFED